MNPIIFDLFIYFACQYINFSEVGISECLFILSQCFHFLLSFTDIDREKDLIHCRYR